MKLTLMIGAMALVMLAAKKKPVFGQLTLTGQKALDWLKTDEAEQEGGVSYTFSSIRMVITDTLASEGWNVPEWKDGRTWTVLGTLTVPEYANPIWVHQPSAVKAIEFMMADWEAKGAEVDDKMRSIDFGDEGVTLNFFRPPGKFARYVVKQEP